MKFTRTEPDENFPLLRLVSETGRWELGLRQMLFGVRVSAGLVGDAGCTVDYCAGASGLVQVQLLTVLTRIFEGLPETISQAEVKAMMPPYERRPINLDPVCWARLAKMAEQTVAS